MFLRNIKHALGKIKHIGITNLKSNNATYNEVQILS